MGILKGLKVLDFSTLLPGPFATLMLADMGADVIHVESPTRVDMVRTMEPVDREGISAAHRHLNRSKKSLALDLKNPESIDVIHSLLQEYDIVIEQFRPGVMTRLGLDYESLKKINPRIIYCSITGYGQTGPFANRAGHDSNYLSVAGVMDYSRRKGERPPVLGVQVADIAGGSLHSVVGILAAVYHREKTGEGQFIDISMTDASFSLNALYGSGYLAHGVEPQPENLTLNGGEFYDYYETKDGRFFSVGSLEPPFRKMLCESLGAVELIGIAFSENQEDKAKFKEEVATRFLTKDFHEWLEIFNDEFDGCVEPVLTFAEASEHPQIKAREMIIEVPNENGTMQKQIAFPIKFSTNPAVYRQTGGQVGEHNEAILRDYGYLKS
ncbi:CoA transferase [Sporosarcina sp. Marseille-Q4063]|uniref:CaiB/BaiF CoA transferase family protein n=1 Tax=Sporosarcina sp. Marseille-Q4063 TaxID=2810514 RepID=UPI001BAE71EB|nr:CaiB/BaiF CoA-transferase family protein [Sporosarcina sp. Marseille-Q4063]QUW21388.1 CoA transferase [Sporosarcina sp. Marseille-Q4063]